MGGCFWTSARWVAEGVREGRSHRGHQPFLLPQETEDTQRPSLWLLPISEGSLQLGRVRVTPSQSPTPAPAHCPVLSSLSARPVLRLPAELGKGWCCVPCEEAQGPGHLPSVRLSVLACGGSAEAFPLFLILRGPICAQPHPQRQAPVPARPALPTPLHPRPPPTGQAGEPQPPRLGHWRRYQASWSLHPHSSPPLTGVTPCFQALLTCPTEA